MAEEMHPTGNRGEPTMIPQRGDADPVSALETHGLRYVILSLDGRLDDATMKYAAASANLAEAITEEAEARQELTWHETIARDHAHATGMPGTNEAARKAYLDRHLLTDNVVAGMRSRLEEAQRARVLAERDYGIVDQAQKALKVRLAALTALVGSA